MRTIETEVFTFDELSDSAKQSAIDSCRDCNVDYYWWEMGIDNLKEIGAAIGISINNIYFSGFSSQGDGACFTGNYQYKKGALKTVKDEYPTATELHGIAESLQLIQSKNFYQLTANVSHSGRYSHEYCTDIIITRKDDIDVSTETEEELTGILRDYMRYCYKCLEIEYDYLVSDEAVTESIQRNEWEFTEEGERV